MENPRHNSSPATGRRSSGPQGTQLFSADELNKLALETALTSDGRASANEPVLEGMQGGLQGRRFLLRAGRQTIGRRDDNDIVINDLSVSSAHAWIMNQQGHYVVMNTLSTNGTFVNNKRVHEATIGHGDVIRFGQVEFVFLTREPGASRRARVIWSAWGAVALTGLCALAWWWLKA
ncbi:FHA domain-containing protein [Dyella silvae]|uniref:FHA domain-containing protein n=1 Tax=Dyella silvae TaxID=2994424 RepID=UPI002265442D|nr:FHA domain-containing protein [Dyella silvae]